MASKPSTATNGGASASPNVVRLPTAAPRKIDNFRFKEQRAQIGTMRAETAGRFPYKHALVRKAERDAETLMGMTRSAALVIALAMFKTLPVEGQEAAREAVGHFEKPESEIFQQAMLAMTLAQPMDRWDFSRLFHAVKKLNGEV